VKDEKINKKNRTYDVSAEHRHLRALFYYNNDVNVKKNHLDRENQFPFF